VVQSLVVALLVAVAAGYAAWALAPRALRATLAKRAFAWSEASPRCPAWLRTRLARLANSAAATGCDACGSRSPRHVANAHVPRKNP
jgi:Family of unknown function (DUF6587)